MRALLRLTAEFADKAHAAASMTELTGHLEDVGRELGFRDFALVHHVSLRRSLPRLIESSNYPAVLSEMFVDGGLFVHDPVLHAGQRTAAALAWHDMGRLLSISRRNKAVMSRSRREGIGEGMTVPARVPGEPNGSCSFATRPGRSLPCRSRLLTTHLVGLHALERARQLHGLSRVGEQVPHLSPREEDCLRLLVGGASDKLIARQLTPSTNASVRGV